MRSVVDFIEGRDLRDVVLVGHSFGGSVVSRVSQEIPERLARLVFHTAFVVEDGASVNDKTPRHRPCGASAAGRGSQLHGVGTVKCLAPSGCRQRKRPPVSGYQSEPSTSPPAGVRAAHHVWPVTLLATKRTLPSPNPALMPPVRMAGADTA